MLGSVRARTSGTVAWFCLALVVSMPVRAQDTGAVRLLDVPFVPQSPALCGGAAVSMVLRFWGAKSVRATDFASLVASDGAGIRAVVLEQAVRERGWNAWPVAGGMTGLAECLTRGRPVIALIDDSGATHHYVVVVALTEDRVCLHDPARGPFRLVDRAAFERAWAAAGEWALLVLPREESLQPAPSTLLPTRTAASDCDSLIDRGISIARAGDALPAERLLQEAIVRCPNTARPFGELAGIRFLQERWFEAESLALCATQLPGTTAHNWQVIAVSRYMQGDSRGALRAWNVIDAPRIDVTRIDGLGRTRYDVVTRFLGLPSDGILSDSDLRRARRRLDALPTRSAARLGYVPLADGSARVDVNVLEKPNWNLGRRTLPLAGVRAVVEREFALESASPLGLGDAWQARWRWWENRPRLAFDAQLPAHGVLWAAHADWERQAVRLGSVTTQFERRTASLSVGQWIAADMRCDGGVSFSRDLDRGADLAIEGAIETRHAGDRIALRAVGGQAWMIENGQPYSHAQVRAAWRSTDRPDPNHARLTAQLGLAGAMGKAPMSLWPGAGSEPECTARLRAHPLYEDGVITGQGWGRTLAHGGIEAQSPPARMKLASLRFAAFVDVAKPWLQAGSTPRPTQLDVGAGLRMQLAAQRQTLRIDYAHGTRDGENAISVGFETDGVW